MKVLLFGKNGQLGWELNRRLQAIGTVVAFGREDADFSKPESLREIVRAVKPSFIVNAVAYTKVESAEKEEALANTVNSIAPGVLAEEAKKQDALLVHYSTDYVFDGAKKAPYTELDEPNPINAYGRSKLAGEQSIASAGCKHVIIRTSWLYSSRGHNFFNTMINLSKDQKVIKVVRDQVGSPSTACAVADCTIQVLAALAEKDFDDDLLRECQLLHMASSGEASWYDFAKEIFRLRGATDLSDDIRVVPIKSTEYPSKIKRPVNSVLDCGKLKSLFDIECAHWKKMLQDLVSGLNHSDTAVNLANTVDLLPHGGGDGYLIALEELTDIVPFEIKRMYYIYGVREDLRRGFHAHKELKQLLVCVSGRCAILLDDGDNRQTVILDSPRRALLIDKPLWREMFDFSPDCVLVVLASQHYNPDDYINSFKEYKKFLKRRSV